MLRYSFVTHLQAGDDVRTVQGFSGLADVRSRMVYTHRTVLNKADEAYAVRRTGCSASLGMPQSGRPQPAAIGR